MKNIFVQQALHVQLAISFIITLFFACDHDDQVSPEHRLPQMFKIEGTASGSSDELDIDCLCDLIVELDSLFVDTDGNTYYNGVHGGHFSRKVLDPTGAGIALVPDVFGVIAITQFPDGSLNFQFPANNQTGSRFWDSLGVFKGTFQGEMVIGSWTCAPFDIREDTAGIASGTWELVPL